MLGASTLSLPRSTRRTRSKVARSMPSQPGAADSWRFFILSSFTTTYRGTETEEAEEVRAAAESLQPVRRSCARISGDLTRGTLIAAVEQRRLPARWRMPAIIRCCWMTSAARNCRRETTSNCTGCSITATTRDCVPSSPAMCRSMRWSRALRAVCRKAVSRRWCCSRARISGW